MTDDLRPALRIRELRERRGMSHEELGLISLNHPDPLNATPHDRELARAEITSYETGEDFPSWPRIVALAQVLGCNDVLELFERMPIKTWVRRLDQVEHFCTPEWDAQTLERNGRTGSSESAKLPRAVPAEASRK